MGAADLPGGDRPGRRAAQGGLRGRRGFFTRDDSGAVVGVDLGGRLFTRVRA
ncbi:UNVERIFIED_ORG: hypothetical protein FHR35_003592 [Microbispora rosea subsp. rosea]